MTPVLMAALVNLLAQALSKGIELPAILSKVKETGEVPDEAWDRLAASISENEKPWL